MSETSLERKKVRSGRDVLLPLTEESHDDWSMHIRNGSFIVTFSNVTRMDSGGFHCWSDGSVRMFVEEGEDSFVPVEIQEKLADIADSESF